MSMASKCDICGELYELVDEPFNVEKKQFDQIRFSKNSCHSWDYRTNVYGKTLNCCPACVEAIYKALVSRGCKLSEI